jgi:hypothetical protein
LAVFEENQETNSAVRKAAMIIQNLMKKLGVIINVSITALELDPPGRSSDQQQPSHLYAPNGLRRSEAVPGTYQWQQGWRSMNGESAPLDDPLFGFNGPFMDSSILSEW